MDANEIARLCKSLSIKEVDPSITKLDDDLKGKGIVKDIDVGSSGDGLGKYLQIRVAVDISKLLKRCLRVYLTDSEEASMLLVRYERLPEFCFHCVFVGHIYRECYGEDNSATMPT
ncbi:hypothetical protein JRO89_XS11G0185100 [Xanthoceras sorbifolium]|uniref:Zinc knuckle CX2CX4HX4C domain-containing protein n=1 Tax=Xanthoceras sorbifolium TaxID=99658 RepID=A0ABQ8HG32_9ROSI|nr:hypothetical protein JRO89_XS11G0185100 [Xanthoceras sorbifolium]